MPVPLFSTVSRAVSDSLGEVLWPTRCVACDQPGELLCEECRAALPWIEQRLACPSCGAPYGFLTCTECDGAWAPRATVSALGFHGAPARMVTCLKDAHELRLAPVIAGAMAADVDALCFVPATAEAYARRGYDHMELVSRELSRELRLPLADVLRRGRARDQRELGRDERAKNLSGTMCALDDLTGARLLLVDDVATTGASLAEGARALAARGAASVTACTLARVW